MVIAQLPGCILTAEEWQLRMENVRVDPTKFVNGGTAFGNLRAQVVPIVELMPALAAIPITIDGLRETAATWFNKTVPFKRSPPHQQPDSINRVDLVTYGDVVSDYGDAKIQGLEEEGIVGIKADGPMQLEHDYRVYCFDRVVDEIWNAVHGQRQTGASWWLAGPCWTWWVGCRRAAQNKKVEVTLPGLLPNMINLEALLVRVIVRLIVQPHDDWTSPRTINGLQNIEYAADVLERLLKERPNGPIDEFCVIVLEWMTGLELDDGMKQEVKRTYLDVDSKELSLAAQLVLSGDKAEFIRSSLFRHYPVGERRFIDEMPKDTGASVADPAQRRKNRLDIEKASRHALNCHPVVLGQRLHILRDQVGDQKILAGRDLEEAHANVHTGKKPVPPIADRQVSRTGRRTDLVLPTEILKNIVTYTGRRVKLFKD